MAAAVFTALLPASASKKSGRASPSSTWIKDKLERASRECSSSWIKLDRASPREGPSLWPSRVPGRASLSKDWTSDKLKRSEVEICSKNEDFEELKRSEVEICSKNEDFGARQQDEERRALAYYAGPAFNNSPDPSVLAIPFFIKSPDPSEVSFPVTKWF